MTKKKKNIQPIISMDDINLAKKLVLRMGFKIEKEEDDGGFQKADLLIIAGGFGEVREQENERYKKHLCERFDALIECEDFLDKVIASDVIDEHFDSGDAKRLKKLIRRITTDDRK